MKQNLQRIAQKIKEEERGEYKVKDMIRSTITVKNPLQLKTVYNMLHKIGDIQIVKMKNKLNSGL